MNNDTQMNFDFSKTTALTCDCGNHTFVQGVFLRKVSALVSPNGKEGIIPLPTFICNSCGKVPSAVVPSFMKEQPSISTPVAPKPTLTLV